MKETFLKPGTSGAAKGSPLKASCSPREGSRSTSWERVDMGFYGFGFTVGLWDVGVKNAGKFL